MRKTIALILCFALLLLSGCTDKIGVEEEPSTDAPKKEVELMRDFPKGAFVTTVTVPYRNAGCIDVSGDCLYMSVYDGYQADGTDMLVCYNVKTCDKRVLFELPYDSRYDDCFIEAVQTDGKWLVWEVCGLMTGHHNTIYVMNLESGETHLAKEMGELNSSQPILLKNKVVWSESDEESSAIYIYDCNSKSTEETAKVKSPNIALAADGDKFVWYADGEFAVYNCADGKTEKIKASAQNVRALTLKENRIFADCDNRVAVIDVATKEIQKAQLGAESLVVTDDYVACKLSGIVSFIRTDSLTENEKLARYYVSAMGTDGNRLVTVSENEGKYANEDGTLIEQLWVHIYDFDKLSEVK